jgi:ABC-type branched-subunit amino acid transport system substrate-binding protein
LAPLLTGVVVSSPGEFQTTSPGWAAFRRRYVARFHDLDPLTNPADTPILVNYYTATEALAQALARSHSGGAALRRALAATGVDSPTGPVRLDANHQAIVSTYLVRFDPRSRVLLPTVGVVRGVEQSFGGYFTSRTPVPSLTQPGCHRAPPPSWAR